MIKYFWYVSRSTEWL